MKVYNFDKVISRDGTYSAKYNNKGREIIPLSVADMDIPVADFMVSELSVANQKGIYGYTLLSDDWQQVTAQWYQRHYSWKVNPEHIVLPTSGTSRFIIYPEFYPTGRCYCQPAPAYHPISHAVEVNHRVLLESALLYRDRSYEIDFADLEDKFKTACCFILISPHNPTGTIWSEDNLRKIASLAEKYNVFIISDDVHADFNFIKNIIKQFLR